jgi:hypothetical protein
MRHPTQVGASAGGESSEAQDEGENQEEMQPRMIQGEGCVSVSYEPATTPRLDRNARTRRHPASRGDEDYGAGACLTKPFADLTPTGREGSFACASSCVEPYARTPGRSGISAIQRPSPS